MHQTRWYAHCQTTLLFDRTGIPLTPPVYTTMLSISACARFNFSPTPYIPIAKARGLTALWHDNAPRTKNKYFTVTILVAIALLLSTNSGSVNAASNTLANNINSVGEAQPFSLKTDKAARLESLELKYDNSWNAVKKEYNSSLSKLKKEFAKSKKKARSKNKRQRLRVDIRLQRVHCLNILTTYIRRSSLRIVGVWRESPSGIKSNSRQVGSC